MLKKLKEKKGNEILQLLVIVAVIGALAITVCVAISGKLRKTTENNLNSVGSGLTNGVNGASTPININ